MLKSFLFFLGCLSLISFSFSVNANTSHESTTQYVKDSGITADIKACLLADSDVKSFHISVKTVKGVVILTGDVETQAQKDKASANAKEVDGVKSVKNKLKITPLNSKSHSNSDTK